MCIQVVEQLSQMYMYSDTHTYMYTYAHTSCRAVIGSSTTIRFMKDAAYLIKNDQYSIRFPNVRSQGHYIGTIIYITYTFVYIFMYVYVYYTLRFLCMSLYTCMCSYIYIHVRIFVYVHIMVYI